MTNDPQNPWLFAMVVTLTTFIAFAIWLGYAARQTVTVNIDGESWLTLDKWW